MEECCSFSLNIPEEKRLRYKCAVHGCASGKTFSLFSVMDHLAWHFSELYHSKRIYNYYCNLCKLRFYILGMCGGCKCGPQCTEERFVQLKPEVTMEDVKRDVQFSFFVHKHAVPVLESTTSKIGDCNQPSSNSGASYQVPVGPEGGSRRTNDTQNPQPAAERRSRSAVRQPPPESRPGNNPPKKPVPPPLPKRVSRSPGRNREQTPYAQTGENGQGTSTASNQRRSRSTVRRPPVRCRQDSLLTDNPPPPSVSRRQMSRSPGPKSRVESVEQKTECDPRSPGGQSWMTMPSPSYYPDGTPRTPHYSDEDEEIEPAYYRTVRNRSQSRSGASSRTENEEARDLARRQAMGAERPTSATWNGSLPKPQLFSNIFVQDHFPTPSSSVPQNMSPAEPIGSSVPGKTRNESMENARDPLSKEDVEVEPHPTPPNHDPPPPPNKPAAVESVAPPPPPPPPEEEPPSCAYYKTAVDDARIRLTPPPAPPPPSSLGVRLSTSSQPVPKPVLPPSAPSHNESSATTVRSVHKKSRQDALLEENPSPPRTPRCRVSRSPGPSGSSHNIEFGSKTPTYDPHTSWSGGPTPAYGTKTSSGMQWTSAHESTKPFCFAKTPQYHDGSPEYTNAASIPGHGIRAPIQGCQKPFYGSQTPAYDRSPGPGPPSRGQHTNGRQTSFHGSQSQNYGSRSPGPAIPNQEPQTASYAADPRLHKSRNSRDGSSTPSYGNRSSREQSRQSSRSSSRAHGLNTGYSGHTPMRSPATYSDGTPRSPRYEDNEEEAVPSYMRSPGRKNSGSDGNTQAMRAEVPNNDPLSLENRARTPPPPENVTSEQNTSSDFTNPPSTSNPGFNGQAGMPPFCAPIPQNPFMPVSPFGHIPFMYPVHNQYGVYPATGMPPMGVPPPPPPPPPPQPSSVFPNLQVPPLPFAPPQQLFAPMPVPQPPNISMSGARTPSSSLPPHSTASTGSNAREEQQPTHSTATSKKSAPPQRVGGSVFLETPPPAPKPSVPPPKSKKGTTKRKRCYSYDRSDSD
ncbi:hypothetical protein RB195_003722 [Necator americanus]|uniref:C2H2-type domain-containing protein n=1 Tax=Necator americanus TaxID=51031 RepID=A0ABR1DPX0_NECAM